MKLALLIFAIALAATTGAQPLSASSLRVSVVCHCAVPAYADALSGVSEALGREPDVIDLDKPGSADALSGKRDASTVLIAIGHDALARAASMTPQGPVIATMVLSSDPGVTSATVEIDLDVPAHVLLQMIRRLFPQFTRVGVLISGKVDREAIALGARDTNIQLLEKEVNGPADLLKSFQSLKGKVDVVVTLPDNRLYNSASVQALILTSLESRLPIIGFSLAFVQAGAAAGVFADFKEAGRQAAEKALRIDSNRSQHSGESVRKVSVALNQRIIRLLGLEYDRTMPATVLR